MATRKADKRPPARGEQATKDKPTATSPGETPQAFYKRVTARPDIRTILERLAK